MTSGEVAGVVELRVHRVLALTLYGDTRHDGYAKGWRLLIGRSRLPLWHLSIKRTAGHTFIRCCGLRVDFNLATLPSWAALGTGCTVGIAWRFHGGLLKLPVTRASTSSKISPEGT